MNFDISTVRLRIICYAIKLIIVILGSSNVDLKKTASLTVASEFKTGRFSTYIQNKLLVGKVTKQQKEKNLSSTSQFTDQCGISD